MHLQFNRHFCVLLAFTLSYIGPATSATTSIHINKSATKSTKRTKHTVVPTTNCAGTVIRTIYQTVTIPPNHLATKITTHNRTFTFSASRPFGSSTRATITIPGIGKVISSNRVLLIPTKITTTRRTTCRSSDRTSETSLTHSTKPRITGTGLKNSTATSHRASGLAGTSPKRTTSKLKSAGTFETPTSTISTRSRNSTKIATTSSTRSISLPTGTRAHNQTSTSISRSRSNTLSKTKTSTSNSLSKTKTGKTSSHSTTGVAHITSSSPTPFTFVGSWTGTSTPSPASFSWFDIPTSTVTDEEATHNGVLLGVLFSGLRTNRRWLTDPKLKSQYIDNVKKTRDHAVGLFNALKDKPPTPDCSKMVKRDETELQSSHLLQDRSLISGVVDTVKNAVNDIAKLTSCATNVVKNLVDSVDVKAPKIKVIEDLTDSLEEIGKALKKADDNKPDEKPTSTRDKSSTSSSSSSSSSSARSCTATATVTDVTYIVKIITNTKGSITATSTVSRVSVTTKGCSIKPKTVTSTVSASSSLESIDLTPPDRDNILAILNKEKNQNWYKNAMALKSSGKKAWLASATNSGMTTKASASQSTKNSKTKSSKPTTAKPQGTKTTTHTPRMTLTSSATQPAFTNRCYPYANPANGASPPLCQCDGYPGKFIALPQTGGRVYTGCDFTAQPNPSPTGGTPFTATQANGEVVSCASSEYYNYIVNHNPKCAGSSKVISTVASIASAFSKDEAATVLKASVSRKAAQSSRASVASVESASKASVASVASAASAAASWEAAARVPRGGCMNFGDTEFGGDFAIYDINGWGGKGGIDLLNQLDGCGELGGVGWRPHESLFQGKTQKTQILDFGLDFFKGGCVERAVKSAGGPSLKCQHFKGTDEEAGLLGLTKDPKEPVKPEKSDSEAAEPFPQGGGGGGKGLY